MEDREKTLCDWAEEYQDEAESHRRFSEIFKSLVNEMPWLKEHRDFIERGGYGMGEREFHWMWKLLADEMPSPFKFVEIGVYKGQVPSLIRLLADHAGKQAQITGVTMLSSFSGNTGKDRKFQETDYLQHIKDVHSKLGLEFGEDQIVKGDSTLSETQDKVAARGPFDIVYVDGCHEYDFVVKDIAAYGNMLKPGGFLVMDDACNFKNVYWGRFWGKEDVSKAVRDHIEGKPMWKEVLSVVHNRVFRRVI